MGFAHIRGVMKKRRTHSQLTQTDLHLTALDGTVQEVGEVVVARRPNNPGYRWGNYLLLPGPPDAEELDDLIALFNQSHDRKKHDWLATRCHDDII